MTAKNLALQPGMGARTDAVNVRRLPLRRYPYTIFYRTNFEDEAVELLRVVHGARVKDRGKVPE